LRGIFERHLEILYCFRNQADRLMSALSDTDVRAFQRNSHLAGLQCLRCAARYPVQLLHEGCPACRVQGHFVSLRAAYACKPEAGCVNQPYAQPFTLEEGGTPCTLSLTLAHMSGVGQLWIKDESRNPTGSHKDRMSAIGITKALEMGAHTVVLASSGNAAISAARYAQAAGLRCEVACYADMPSAYVQELDALGAQRFDFADNAGRWAFVSARAAQPGYLALTNHHLPALGSAPLAVEGYKLIAQECFAQGCLPSDVMVPTARGDLAWGVFAGFQELLQSGSIAELPKIWIVEPFARLSEVLSGQSLHASYLGQTAQFSTAGATVTYLQYQAVTASDGGAVVVSDDAASAAREILAALGISAELCAAAAFAAVGQLKKQGELQASSQVLWLLSANASRDPSLASDSDSLT
jgi:threonine synthase